jgi:hypothetical protein
MEENKNQDDILKKFIQDTESANRPLNENFTPPTNNTNAGNGSNETFVPSNAKISSLDYLSIDTEELPLGIFYPDGFRVSIRAAKVSEIQAYSVVNERNLYDVTEKMNDLLRACVRVTLPGGKIGSYLDIKDGDRLYLIFAVRELTFQKGSELYLTSKCEECREKVNIEMRRGNFRNFEMPEELAQYFDPITKKFTFQLNTGQVITLGPPTIGLQKAFYEFIKKQVEDKENPDVAFLKIVPWTISDRNNITPEGAEKKLVEFKNMPMDNFLFLDSAIGKMTFGIKELVKQCTCGSGQEVRTEFRFPVGAAGLFTVSGSFGQFVKK